MKIVSSFLFMLFILNTLCSLELVVVENKMSFSMYVWFEYECFASGRPVEYLQIQKIEPSKKSVFHFRATLNGRTIILSKMHIYFLQKHYEVVRDFFSPMAVQVPFRACRLSMKQNCDLLVSCAPVMNLQQEICLHRTPITTRLLEKVKYYEPITVKQIEFMKQVLKDYNAASKKD